MTEKKGRPLAKVPDRQWLTAVVIVLILTAAAVVITAVLIREKRAVPDKGVVAVLAVVDDEPGQPHGAKPMEYDSMAEESTAASEWPVDLNTADAETLMELDGIGESLAAAIIEYRNEHPFTSVEEIKQVKGIGEKKFEAIKDDVCV